MDEQKTGTNELKNIVQQLVEGKKQERIAQGDVSFSKRRLGDQRKHLDHLLSYREECASGLRFAGNDLTIAQMRDYELLLQHLDVVVDAQQQRLQESERQHEVCSQHLLDVQDNNQELDMLLKARLKLQEEANQTQDNPQPVKPEAGRKKKFPEDTTPGKSMNPSYM
jgi:flagellar biosynthesis chaperone FliJ